MSISANKKSARPIVVAALIGGAIALSAPEAAAQEAGFVIDRFRPAERGSDWFALDALDMRGHGRFALGVVGHYSGRSYAVYSANDDVRFSPLASQFVLHPGGVVRLWDTLRLGLDLPLAVSQTGTGGAFRGSTLPAADGGGVGDLRVAADVRVLGDYEKSATFALGAQAFLPTGARSRYLSDGSLRVMPRAQLAGIVGAFQYAAYVGALLRGANTAVRQTMGSELQIGASAGLRLADGRLVVGPEIYGGTTVADKAFSREQTPLEGLLGLHYAVTPDIHLGAGVAAGLTRAIGTPVLRGLFSLEWAPHSEPPDRDGDGIPDAEDACPDTKGVRTSDPKTNGCPPPPPPPPDRDGDGIIDAEDACPDTKGVRTSDPKTNGCPPDRDGDGVLDDEDACVDVPGRRTSDPATSGCPDSDGDGIIDKDDACPKIPGVRSTNPKFNGCPVDIDSDQILNDVDACPELPGKPNADPTKNGCPTARIEQKQIKIIEQVKFVTGSAKIDPGKDSEEVLEAVLKVLKENPQIKKVRVEGHTDARGSADLNRKLSAARAKSVIDWLVKHGLSKDMFTGQGFGPDRPIDTNDTDTGRRNNRRSEFHIVEEAPKDPAGDAATPAGK